MTYGSLFSGIGGIDLGLDRAGLECRFQVEIDPFRRKVLEKHWPNVKRYGDITQLTGYELERVDLLCGGFPCVDVSRVGLRAGIRAARSGLWADYFRLVRQLRPSFVLVENVAGLLDGGIGRVLGDLATGGYDAEWRCYSAAQFGLPHVRERVFIIAYPRGSTTRCIGLEPLLPTPIDDWPEFLLRARGGSVNGLSRAVAGLSAYGNAVVPQIAERIGKIILCADARRRAIP